MPRRARIAPGEIIYHALNRANGCNQLFDKSEDYAASHSCQPTIQEKILGSEKILGAGMYKLTVCEAESDFPFSIIFLERRLAGQVLERVG